MPLEGLQIGRYHILRLLGSGGMGEVYLAEDARIEQQVAIKVIRSEVNPYPHTHGAKETTRLFQREAKAIVKLDHPHILPLFDYGEEIINGINLIYIVMPFRQEGSLADWLRQRDRAELFSPQEVAHFVTQAADALEHAHNHQIIHQDVKPSNLLVRSRQDTPDQPDILLADFGIAKLMTTTSSASQSIRGTPVYMAPEQCVGAPVTASDQYALAVMAYELLTGQPPFQGGAMYVMYQHLHDQPQPPSKLNDRLAGEIDAVLLRALAKRSQERFASITDFAQAFAQATQSLALSAFLKPMNTPGEGDIHTPIESSEVQNIKTRAPEVTNTSPQPAASNTDSRITPVSKISMAPLNTSFENGDPRQHSIGNAGTIQQDMGSVAQGKPTHILEENEVHAHPLTGTITPPLQESSMIGPRRRTKRRPLLVTAFVLLTVLLVVFGSIAYAAPSTFSSLANHVSGIFSNVPLTASSATVMITPARVDLKKSYSIPAVIGTPDASKHQVQARILSSTSSSQSKTVNTTGSSQTAATYAKGTLDYTCGVNDSPETISAGTVLTGHDGIQVVTDVTKTENCGGPDVITHIPAHAVEPGPSGNIAAGDMYYPNHGTGGHFYDVTNDTAFDGGVDAQTVPVVRQSDIDGAANTLITANTPNPRQVLQTQVHSNEQLVGSPQCEPNVTHDHAAGDEATSVTVTVTFTCTGEVYDQDGALSMAEKILQEQATTDLGAGYVLVGKVTKKVTHAQITKASDGTISVSVNAEGVWVYQFSSTEKQELAKLIAGKKKQDALVLLSRHKGVSHSDMRISGGDGNTLPTDPSQIKIEVQAYRA